MPTIVTGTCKGCRFTDCVTVCPVKAIFEEADLAEARQAALGF